MTKNNHHDDCPGCDSKNVICGTPIHDNLIGPTINSCVCVACRGSTPSVKNVQAYVYERGGKIYKRTTTEYIDGSFTDEEVALHDTIGSVMNACQCKHSFLVRGCTCGAIVPYANMKLISK